MIGGSPVEATTSLRAIGASAGGALSGRRGFAGAVPWGIGGDPMHSGHTDEAYVELDRLPRSCQIVLAAALDYLNDSEGE